MYKEEKEKQNKVSYKEMTKNHKLDEFIEINPENKVESK